MKENFSLLVVDGDDDDGNNYADGGDNDADNGGGWNRLLPRFDSRLELLLQPSMSQVRIQPFIVEFWWTFYIIFGGLSSIMVNILVNGWLVVGDS